MSKSLWSRSVWNSLFGRTSSKRLAKVRRNGQRVNLKASAPMETLEERVVLAAEVAFNSGTNVLTVTDLAAGGSAITINSGSVYTDILVDGKFQTRLLEANTDNIGTITFTGGAGTDTLSVNGVNGLNGKVTINLTTTERILLNTKTTTITSDETDLAFGKSTVAGALTVSAVGNVTQFGKVNVSGETNIDADVADSITLSSSGNSFGRLLLIGSSVNINEAGPTNLGLVTTAAAGSLTVKSTGAISDSGVITAGTGGTTLTASGNSITFDEATSSFAGVLAAKGTNISIDNNVATDLGNITATGTFTLTSNGAVAHTAGNVKVTGAATITTDTPATNDITITVGTNNFGSLSLTGNDVSITEKSSMDLGTTTATGDLTVIAKGAITDSGQIDVDDDASFTTTGNSDITLDESTSTYGAAFGNQLALTGRNISVLNNATATDLGIVSAKGTFTLDSTNGAVTQANTATVIGRATVTAANGTADITLDDVANTFGSVSVFGDDVEIVEVGAMNLFTSEIAGDLTLDATGAAGAVTDSGTIQVGGDTDIDATLAITLDTSDSFYTGGITLDGTNVAITNVLETDFDSVVATGDFTVISDEDVTDTGTVLVTGRVTVTTPEDIILDSANTAASIALSGGGGGVGEVRFVDSAGGLDIVSASSVGNLIVTTTGALSDSGTVTVTGDTTLTATGGSMILNSAASTYSGTVTVTTATLLTLVDSDSNLTLPTVTLTGSGAVNLTAGGDITVTTIAGLGASLAMNGGSSGSLSLTSTTVVSNLSPVTLTGVNATLSLTGAERTIGLGNDSLSGTFSLTGTAVGVVSQVASTKLTVAGQVTIDTTAATDDNITLSNIGNTFGTLVLTGVDLSVREAAATNFGATTASGTLTVISSGAVSDSGTMLIDGTTSVTATGNDIALDSAANSFDGALTLTGANVTIQDDTTTVLAALTATGTFTLTTATAVTQTGDVVVGGLATITTGTTIDLDTAANTINFGSLALSGTAIDIQEDSATNFASVSGTTLDVVSAGAITDSGTLTVADSTFKAGTTGLENITLDDPSSTFGNLTLDGGTVTLVENAATVLTDGATSIAGGAAANQADGNMTITSAGAVDHLVGTLTVLGQLNINSNSGTGAVTLAGGTDNFNSLSITAGSATVDEDSATTLATTTVTGAFTLTTAGDVDDSGVLALGGTTTITTSAGGDITLDEVGSTFNSIDLSGGDVTILAYSGLTIIDADATAGDLIIIASGGITDGGVARTISATSDIFIQAGLDTADPTRELDPTDPVDFAMLNALDLAFSDPTFGATETYVGSIVNHL